MKLRQGFQLPTKKKSSKIKNMERFLEEGKIQL